MKNNDQLDQIKELKREVLEKEQMLCTAGNRLSELNHILNKQKEESHEKDKIIQSLQDEINTYKDKENNTKAMTIDPKNSNLKAFVGAKTKVVGFIRKKLSSKYLIL